MGELLLQHEIFILHKNIFSTVSCVTSPSSFKLVFASYYFLSWLTFSSYQKHVCDTCALLLLLFNVRWNLFGYIKRSMESSTHHLQSTSVHLLLAHGSQSRRPVSARDCTHVHQWSIDIQWKSESSKLSKYYQNIIKKE